MPKKFRRWVKKKSKNYTQVSMDDLEKQVLEVLHNLNWLLESHDSYAELIEIKGKKVIIRCVGYCSECETDCVGVAFKERMPHIELIVRSAQRRS